MSSLQSLQFLSFFKDYILSKEKNPDLVMEKITASFMCTNAPNVIWTYFDLETCNRDPADINIRNGTIIEIGAVCGEKEFSVLCNPGHPITNSHIHHIEDSDVAGKENTEKVLRDFLRWVQGLKKTPDDVVVLIAHNAANFDRKVLVNHIRTFDLEDDLDGLVIADSLYPIKAISPSKQGKLEVVYKELFSQSYVEKHRALDDSKDLQRIVEYICRKKKQSMYDILSNYMYLLES